MDNLRKCNLKLSKSQIIVIIVLVAFVLNTFSFSVSAVGIVDNPESNGLPYTKYPSERYVLDYGSSGWIDMGAVLNAICNALFFLCNCLGNFTGAMVKEAYNLDFVKTFADKIGEMIQSIAGINGNGIGTGLFSGFLLILLFVLGIYIVFEGIIKHATSKVVGSIFNFFTIFIVGIVFVAYSPTLISNVADFSSEMNTGVLGATSFVFFDNEDEWQNDSIDDTDIIYNNIWNVTVYQPWKLLEFGDTDIENDRIDSILKYDSGTEERDNAANSEIDNHDNKHIKDVGAKFGIVLLVLIVDIIICIFVFLLTGLLIITQFMFLIFACILPFIFVFSMIPGMSGKLTKYSIYMFNLLLSKTGISLVLTLSFCLSSLFLSLSKDYAYLFIAFLQICCFVGVFIFLPRILSFMGLENSMSQMTNSIMVPMRRGLYRMRYQRHRLFHSHRGNKGKTNILKNHHFGNPGNLLKNFSNRRSKKNKGSKDNTDEKHNESNSSNNAESTNRLDSSNNLSQSNNDNRINERKLSRSSNEPDNKDTKVNSKTIDDNRFNERKSERPNMEKNKHSNEKAKHKNKQFNVDSQNSKNVGVAIRPDIVKRQQTQQMNIKPTVDLNYSSNNTNYRYPVVNDNTRLNGQVINQSESNRSVGKKRIVSRTIKNSEIKDG